MGYWYIELSDGRIALITDDPFFRPEGRPEQVLDEVMGKVEEMITKVSEAIYGDWKDLLDRTDE
ncbi:hypothetical protein [Salinithrix halophila]|uniref:Uncharacterized protein n=1 Tax=Salinithrix halophila TaxID=1485204 RepID=A0ABV8JEH2_9BACL